MSNLNRREFARIAGAAAFGAGATLAANPQASDQIPANNSTARFPASFVWGCATAAYQVEGAVSEDGRKPSIWDTYSHSPGRVDMDHNGDVSVDQYHRYREDIEHLQWLGCKAYRFSISWSRVLPNGFGQVNEKGFDHYDRLVDELLQRGIEPYATLFHWDLPQALEDKYGGWQSRDAAKHFGDYAEVVGKRLSDRITHFFTMNEFSCFTDDGYGSGTKAPGKVLGNKARNQVRHHAVLGHGMAVRGLRGAARKPVQIGLAENSALCVPVIESDAHILAARTAMRELNAPFLTAILEGKYTDHYLSTEGANAPVFTAEDLKTIAAPLDFVGLNCYGPTYVRADEREPLGFSPVPPPESYPHMESWWLLIGPEILYWAPRHLKEIWKVEHVVISENGCSSHDRPAADGKVYDSDRIMYLRNNLTHAQRAIEEGWPLKAYFCWSLLDNFEWTDGYTKRFGLFYVNFATQERTPKLSADFYREVIARNRVV
jgi:beta-glucosidase